MLVRLLEAECFSDDEVVGCRSCREATFLAW